MTLGLLLACSSTAAPTGAASDAARDVSDDAVTDAATDAVTDAVDASTPPPDAPGPLDGTWRVTDIACNGTPASGGARLFITAPNSSSFEVAGARSTYALSTPTCVVRLESDVTYPSAGRAVFTARGAFACTPARCASNCDTTPTVPYVYDYTVRGASLVMTSVGPIADMTCTGFGQMNPITYTYARQ